jgi:hypothetical protein
MGLIQQLAEKGVLNRLFPKHWLFQSSNQMFGHRLINELSFHPRGKNALESVTIHFAISRATVSCKLKREKLQYREGLAQGRI